MSYAIEVRNFTKRFGYKTVVDNNSFQVREGSIYGFIGPNGAGKTTTINSLLGLVIPTAGDLTIEGKKVIADPYFNQNVGYVPSEPNFAKDIRVEKFIYLCGMLRDISPSEVETKLKNSPLNGHRHKLCQELSTGWKKILMVFVAFNLYKPKILILDEVRNGLDPTVWFQLSEKLKKFRSEGGTVFLSTHILSDLQELADEIIMINEGKVIYSGKKDTNVEELYKKLIIEQKPDGTQTSTEKKGVNYF
jgi:ABC-2 type transport system ATP-binding protein